MAAIERKARIDVLTSCVGAAICCTFVLSLHFGGPAAGNVPIEQAIGMVFTCLLSPVLYFTARSFYLRQRTKLLLIVRLVFIWGTTHDYGDTPHQELT